MAKDRKVKAGSRDTAPPPIYVVSGGSGASGTQVVETVLAQFAGVRVPVVVVPRVRHENQIEDAMARAAETGGTVAHTMVDARLRRVLVRLGRAHGVVTIDLMGPLLTRMKKVLSKNPLEQPGLYRKLRMEYYERIEAIEFAVTHDDGQKPHDLPLADIILLGVSRCGKTPLSMYLAVQGLKTANVPLIPGVPPPEDLRRADPHRVIGLSIELDQLLSHRRKRQERMGTSALSQYTKPSAVLEELENAKRLYQKGGYHTVRVTDKPIETIAEEVTDYFARHFPARDLS